VTYDESHGLVESTRKRRILVDRARLGKRAVGEDQMERIDLAAQDTGERAATTGEEPQLSIGFWKSYRRVVEGFFGSRFRQGPANGEGIVGSSKRALFREYGQQTIKQRLVANRDTERGSFGGGGKAAPHKGVETKLPEGVADRNCAEPVESGQEFIVYLQVVAFGQPVKDRCEFAVGWIVMEALRGSCGSVGGFPHDIVAELAIL
jgi:hypothetical protein